MDNETLKEIASIWAKHIPCFECPVIDKCIQFDDRVEGCQNIFIETLYELIKGAD